MSGDPTKRLLVIGGIGSVLTALVLLYSHPCDSAHNNRVRCSPGVSGLSPVAGIGDFCRDDSHCTASQVEP